MNFFKKPTKDVTISIGARAPKVTTLEINAEGNNIHSALKPVTNAGKFEVRSAKGKPVIYFKTKILNFFNLISVLANQSIEKKTSYELPVKKISVFAAKKEEKWATELDEFLKENPKAKQFPIPNFRKVREDGSIAENKIVQKTDKDGKPFNKLVQVISNAPLFLSRVNSSLIFEDQPEDPKKHNKNFEKNIHFDDDIYYSEVKYPISFYSESPILGTVLAGENLANGVKGAYLIVSVNDTAAFRKLSIHSGGTTKMAVTHTYEQFSKLPEFAEIDASKDFQVNFDLNPQDIKLDEKLGGAVLKGEDGFLCLKVDKIWQVKPRTVKTNKTIKTVKQKTSAEGAKSNKNLEIEI